MLPEIDTFLSYQACKIWYNHDYKYSDYLIILVYTINTDKCA